LTEGRRIAISLLKSGFAAFIVLAVATLVATPSLTYANAISAAVISAGIGYGGPSISTVGTVTQPQCNDQGAGENTFMTVTYAGGTASVSGGGLIGWPPFLFSTTHSGIG
jgi:hypothetical protein